MSPNYLGNILSTSEGLNDMIEDRRNQGWEKAFIVKWTWASTSWKWTFFYEMEYQLTACFLPPRPGLVLLLLLLTRLKVKASFMLRKLTGGHSKCPTESCHLETVTWKLRHHLIYCRIMYQHHSLTIDKTKTIHKIYQKQ